MLAAVPAVLAQNGAGDRLDTVGICHALEGQLYESAQALETDFYGPGQEGHGKHEDDVVPPFTIEILGRPSRRRSKGGTGTTQGS